MRSYTRVMLRLGTSISRSVVSQLPHGGGGGAAVRVRIVWEQRRS